MMKRIGSIVLMATMTFAVACTQATDDSIGDEPIGQVQSAMLDGAYAPANWTSNGISGGTTGITGDASQMTLSYDVSLSGGGVSYRTTTFSVAAEYSGTVSFDWQYDFFHAWYNVNADLILFANSSSGTTQIPLVDFYNLSFTGPQSFSGSTSIPIEQGYTFGLIVGGSNFDSTSVLNGDVMVSNFEVTSPCDDPANATILGTAGNDYLLGTSGDDIIFGLGGDDIIDGKGGHDILCGGDGQDDIMGGDGDDYIEGGAGYNFLKGNAGDDTVLGGDDGNELQGNDGDDDLEGGAGVDTIYGGNGADAMDGGAGNDYMEGGDGHDCLAGGAGNDNVNGGGGDDCLAGDDGYDQLSCGAGNDSYSDGEQVSGCETMGACANATCN